ncbi:hypothetical protein Q6348_14420 [Isoptericola sp. b441]|uniref:AraC family transcriptional regulator n=1 Tax=Actinotalea lenta TaxID=3064654 RepID=A0ABT9DBX8_9CELL|nr:MULTISPECIES: hypothetical protein [unclassified Isoptericola]MDO8108390.1 hypothetical protein [Isoptericola sp. b441]MDO8119809.1 hypothetical protein [Isoptericola sp. b490]
MSDQPVVPDAVEPVAAVVADLASRLRVDSSAVTVRSYEDVTWRDGSLGCPVPGMMYTQALVAGSRIVLEVAGRTYEYHAAAGGRFLFCPDPAPPVGGVTR